MSFTLSVFRSRTCILHHIAFLFCLPAHYFLPPITPFSPLKTYFLAAVLPFSVMFLMPRTGFVYTIDVDVYAFRLAFSGKKHCILHHFSLRLTPKRTAFSTKTHCVQRHIALRLAPNCTTFCCKWLKIWCKRRFLVINIHSPASVNTLPFAPKTTLARIVFLRLGARLVDKIAAIVLKLLLKNGQKKVG